MEITAQIAALEEEVKLLKGEIKSILEEIRTSVLARDNPFALQGGLPVFQPIERSEPTGKPPPEPEEEAPADVVRAPATASEAEDPLPHVLRVEPAAAPPETRDVPEIAPLPVMAGVSPEVAPLPAIAEVAVPQAWSVSTIAGLIAWVDETASRLGTTHLQMILDLARFAGLIPQEAEEALLKVIKLASSRKDSATVSVNDTLVALRQLEAIFQGVESDEMLFLATAPQHRKEPVAARQPPATRVCVGGGPAGPSDWQPPGGV